VCNAVTWTCTAPNVHGMRKKKIASNVKYISDIMSGGTVFQVHSVGHRVKEKQRRTRARRIRRCRFAKKADAATLTTPISTAGMGGTRWWKEAALRCPSEVVAPEALAPVGLCEEGVAMCVLLLKDVSRASRHVSGGRKGRREYFVMAGRVRRVMCGM